jgi:hypothetical protein
MKRITLLIILVALFATSCGFKSKERPLAGTDYVTFTVEGSDKIGVKYPGKDGDTVTPAMYYHIDAFAGYLWATKDANKKEERLYRIWDATWGEDWFYFAHVRSKDNYRIVEENGYMYYISETSYGFIGGYLDLFVARFRGSNYIFGRNTWGWYVMDDNRSFPRRIVGDQVWLFSYNQGKDFIILMRESSKSWDGYSTGSNPKWYGLTDAEVQAFATGAPVWSEAEGDVAIYEKDGPLPERPR